MKLTWQQEALLVEGEKQRGLYDKRVAAIEKKAEADRQAAKEKYLRPWVAKASYALIPITRMMQALNTKDHATVKALLPDTGSDRTGIQNGINH